MLRMLFFEYCGCCFWMLWIFLHHVTCNMVRCCDEIFSYFSFFSATVAHLTSTIDLMALRPSRGPLLSGRLALATPIDISRPQTHFASSLAPFHGIRSGRNNWYIKKFMTETRIHFGTRFNLLIMIGRTRDRRAGLIPHLLTSGLIPSLMVCLSRVN
jgi:hypothetical protein